MSRGHHRCGCAAHPPTPSLLPSPLSGTVAVSATHHDTLAPLTEANPLDEVRAENSWIVDVRRHLHRNPELSFQEFNTAKYIAKLLREIPDIEVIEGVAKTGVVGVLKGGKSGPCVALRADIDALPILEAQSQWNGEYKSTNKAMHACGHDGHVAMVMGAAKVLSQHRSQLNGTVKFLFQPAEEYQGGALPMIEEGVLDGRIGPAVDHVFGAHLGSMFPAGALVVNPGPMMASADELHIIVHGRGGHAAMPASTKDPVVIAAHVITALQTIISRNLDAHEAGVVTIGKITGGTTGNIIPPSVELLGTIRALNHHMRKKIRDRISVICSGIAASFEAKIDVKVIDGYPPTTNTSLPHVKYLQEEAAKIFGKRVLSATPTMGAEDFSYFLMERPGAFFWIGARLPGPIRPHHAPDFDIDERVLVLGASLWVSLARSLLGPVDSTGSSASKKLLQASAAYPPLRAKL